MVAMGMGNLLVCGADGFQTTLFAIYDVMGLYPRMITLAIGVFMGAVMMKIFHTW